MKSDAFEPPVGSILFGHRSGVELMGVKMAFPCVYIDVQESDTELLLLLGQGSIND